MDRPNLYSATLAIRRSSGDAHSKDLSEVPVLQKGDIISHARFAYCSPNGNNRYVPYPDFTPDVEAAVLEKKIAMFEAMQKDLALVKDELAGHWDTCDSYFALVKLVQQHTLLYQNRLVRKSAEAYRAEFDGARFVVVSARWDKDYIGGREPYFIDHTVWARKMREEDGEFHYDPDGPIMIFSQTADPHLKAAKNAVNDPTIHGWVDVEGQENLASYGL